VNLGELALELSQSGSIPFISAFLIGILVSVSPCPLATNIAAMAYITRRGTDRRYAVTTAALYTLGRVVSYSILGVLIVVAGLGVSAASLFLQDIGEQFLGPVLIVVGIIMMNIDRLSLGRGGSRLASIGSKVANWGLIGGFLLGAIFALAFCPFSAILYFGVLIPLALKSTGGIALPTVFAVGTGLPVLVLGVLLSFGVARVSSWVNAINRVQPIIRIAASVIFIGVGIYLVLWAQGLA